MGKARKPTAVKKAGVMNQLEKAYAAFLATRPDVVSFKYEAIRLPLRKRRFYRPDFQVVFADGRMEFHEVKAKHRWYEKGLLKLAWAADHYAELRFVLVERTKGGWTEEVF